MINLIKKFYEIIDFTTKVIIYVLLSFMIINVAMNVFFRYVLHWGICWSEEVARYLMVCLAFLGMSLAIKSDEHINITFITNILPYGVQKVLKYLKEGIVLFFLSMVFIYSFNQLSAVSDQTSIGLMIPMSIPYSSVTIGTFLMILQLLRKIVLMVLEDLKSNANNNPEVNLWS